MLIDGAGSQLNQVGVGTPGLADSGAAFAHIGRAGGTGQATISNGGQWLISDGGQDSRQSGGLGLIIGRDAGSNGSVLISGPGSVLQITSTSLGLPAGTPDNLNPFLGVGYDSAATASGSLTISAGGKLVMTGNAISTAATQRSTTLDIGGHGPSASSTPGNGTVTVSGAGSEISMSGFDTLIRLGNGTGAQGTLAVLDGGKVSTTNLVAGTFGAGQVTLDNATLALSGFRASDQVGAGMTVGRGSGGSGMLALDHGAQLTIQGDTLPGGLSVGGDSFVSGGTGAVTLANDSSVVLSGAANTGSITVGRSGTGSLSLDSASTVDAGTATVNVGSEASAFGSLGVAGGSSVIGNVIHIGGSSDTTAGGSGTAVVSGPGSSLVASGDSGFIGVGRGGTGSLAVSDQATVAATIVNVGRATGGVGTLSVDNATLALSGQQTTGNLAGAALSIGNRGGTGMASITNGSVVNISNFGSNGASLNVGGTPPNPLGNGALSVSNSQINIAAAPGLATARIGHDGNGTATFNASSLNLSNGTTRDGSVIIAGQTGSTGMLSLNAGSLVNAAYVGVGATQSAVVGVQNAAGAGHLVINDSTVNTTTFEIGAGGLLTGNNGVINATGDVIVGGTINPGNSPGRIVINCNLISLAGSKLILEVAYNGTGYDIDQLVIGHESTFDLHNLNIEFDFLGDTDPLAFAQSGGFDLDNFLRVNNDGDFSQGLSTLFAQDTSWDEVIDPTLITAMADSFDVTDLRVSGDGSFLVAATPNAVPEPPSWALMLLAMLVLTVLSRPRRRAVRL